MVVSSEQRVVGCRYGRVWVGPPTASSRMTTRLMLLRPGRSARTLVRTVRVRVRARARVRLRVRVRVRVRVKSDSITSWRSTAHESSEIVPG